MQCPVCGNEMRQGYIQCKQILSWVKTPHWISLRPEPGEVLLGKNLFKGPCFEAYICKKCKKVLFDYSKSNFEEA